MIICCCKQVNEKTIREAIVTSVTLQEAIEKTRASLQCGSCLPDIEALWEEIRGLDNA